LSLLALTYTTRSNAIIIFAVLFKFS